jgi:hypothetical protein
VVNRNFRHPIIAILLAISASPGRASDATEGECFDAEVSASIVHQTPTLIPDCDDCIIMSWPWILDLRVRRVSRGSVALGPITVLTVQHTYFRTNVRPLRWWLRRNMLGTFNAVMKSEAGALPPCPSGAPAARPFIQPAVGTTLDDLRREGENRYGHH